MEFLQSVLNNLELWVLIVTSIGIFFLLVYWHLDKTTRFDLRDLLIDSKDGQLSLFKVGQVLALMVSTWVLINETRNARLTEFLFIGYMVAWSGANVLSKYMNTKNDAPRIYEEPPRQTRRDEEVAPYNPEDRFK
jgi:hypothetical protein